MGVNLVEFLVGRHVAEGGGDRVSYLDPDVGMVSYARLLAAARGYASTLRDSGVEPGSRGLIVADDSVATVVAVLGMWWNGCVPVPVSPVLDEKEIHFVAGDCAADVIHIDATSPARQTALAANFESLPRITGDEVRESVRRGSETATESARDTSEPATWTADRTALIQYTSGSTGVPKGVLHSAAGIEGVVGGFGALLQLRADDTALSTAKLSFGYGFGNSVLFPLAAGASTVLLRGPVDAHVVSGAIRRHRPTVLLSVPRMYATLLAMADGDSAGEFGEIRLAVSAGEHCPAHIADQLYERFGVPLVNGLGATEILHISVATTRSATTPGSTGLPVPGVSATVRDESGEEVLDRTEGRLHIESTAVALGYLNRPEETARTFTRGGAYTGDIVRRAEDGGIQYLCRADDLLNLGGYKVAPSEIESVVRDAEGVADCAVVGAADANGLDQAVAYVVPRSSDAHTQVRRAVLASIRSHLSPFKRPARVEVLDALPVTSTGKLAKYRLRERESEASQ